MIVLETIVHVIYMVMAGLIFASFIWQLYKRKKNQGYVFDIMYAYCCIPFLLRILYIK